MPAAEGARQFARPARAALDGEAVRVGRWSSSKISTTPFYGGRRFGIRDLNGYELYFLQDQLIRRGVTDFSSCRRAIVAVLASRCGDRAGAGGKQSPISTSTAGRDVVMPAGASVATVSVRLHPRWCSGACGSSLVKWKTYAVIANA